MIIKMKLKIGSLRFISGLRKILILTLTVFIMLLTLSKIAGPDSSHIETWHNSRTSTVHIALTGQLTERHPNIFDRLSNITKSIYKHCQGGQLLFHVFTDLNSTIPGSYTDLILKLNSKFTNIKGLVRMYDLETIFSRYENVLQRLIYNYWDRSSIKNPTWALPFRSPVIFLRPIYYLLEELKDVDKIISPDSDMIFMADIYQLYLEFSKMNESQMIGMGPEFVNCDQMFEIYNSQHPSNEVVKKNHVCLNGGLQLSDLEKLRRSKVFNYLITEEGAHEITDKYRMAMYLGDQDMLTLIKTEYPQFFRVLDCRWNYQLNAVYNVPSRMPCEAPAFLYHGNSLQRFPDEVYASLENII